MAAYTTLPTLQVRDYDRAYKRRKGLLGASVVTKSLSINATHADGRDSPEFIELLRSFTKQNSAHAKYSPEFFGSKPSTPLAVESVPGAGFDVLLRERFARAERERKVPPFYIPESDATDFCVLQQRYLAAERDDLRDEMEQLEKEMIILFAENEYKMATSMGTIEFPQRSSSSGATTIPPGVAWMLKYSSCFCSRCKSPLHWEATHHEKVHLLTWYSIPCSHAVRFCEDCRNDAQCWLCGVKARGKRKRVYQDAYDGGIHKSCMVSACECCKLVV